MKKGWEKLYNKVEKNLMVQWFETKCAFLESSTGTTDNLNMMTATEAPIVSSPLTPAITHLPVVDPVALHDTTKDEVKDGS